MPAQQNIPSTIERSDSHAQALWAKTHASAVAEYGDGERAQRTAFAALKNEYEKIGDHWERKAESGPSDEKAEEGRESNAPTQEGVDANASKTHLLQVARRLEIAGRSSMNKGELVEAIKKENARLTRRARE